MEIISMDVRVLDSLIANVNALVEELEMMCNVGDYSDRQWLDNQEACLLLNVSKRTLQHYRDTGRLPFSQIERKVYYKPEDVFSLLNNPTKKQQGHE